MLISFDYRNQSGWFSRRAVWPIRSECTDDKAYLDGFCLVRQARRRFRCDRMENVSADGVFIDEPEPFFAALARSAVAGSPFREDAPDEDYVLKETNRLSADPLLAATLKSLLPGDENAVIIKALTHIRDITSMRGVSQPEAIAATFVEKLLASRRTTSL